VQVIDLTPEAASALERLAVSLDSTRCGSISTAARQGGVSRADSGRLGFLRGSGQLGRIFRLPGRLLAPGRGHVLVFENTSDMPARPEALDTAITILGDAAAAGTSAAAVPAFVAA